MAEPFQKFGRWYLKVKALDGVWRHVATSAKTKSEAKLLQREVAQKIDRQRLGLDPIPGSDLTVGELLNWWLDTYSKGTPSHKRNESAVKRHLLTADLAKTQLHLLAKGDIETLLQGKKEELSPKSLTRMSSRHRLRARLLASGAKNRTISPAAVWNARVPEAIVRPERPGVTQCNCTLKASRATFPVSR